ncbi:MAG: hypothetical protein U0234_29905 [Sandaracinus sp.]
MDDVVTQIAARYGGRFAEGRAHAEIAGVRLRAQTLVSSGVSDTFLVTALVGPLPRLLLRHEVSSDRSAKRWRLVREVQLGDPAFDDRVFIDTRLPDDAARHLLGHGDTRAAVLRALAVAHEIRFDESGLEVHYVCGNDPDLGRASAVVEAAAALARALPRDAARFASDRPWIDRLAVPAILGSVAGCVAFALVAAFADMAWAPVDGWTAGALGAAASMIAWLPLALVLVALVWGRSDALRAIPLVLVLSAVFCAPLGLALVLGLNGALDRAPARDYVLPVRASHAGESDGEPYVSATFADFRDPEGTITLRFEGDHAAGPGARVALRVHDGALGLPWIESASLLDGP